MKPIFENITLPISSSLRIIDAESEAFNAPWHFHPEYEITLIEKGRGIRFVGDSAEEYEPLDFVAIAPNIPHHWKSNVSFGKSKCKVIQFKKEKFGNAFWQMPEMASINIFLQKMSHGLKLTPSEEAISLMIDVSKSKGIEQINKFLSLLSSLQKCEYKELLNIKYFESITSLEKNRCDLTFTLVKKHFKDNITQSEYADMVGLTKESFSRWFKQQTNKNFISYLNEYRIAYSTMLLKETNMKIIEVAYESGFRNLSNFNRQFKKEKSITPYQYRKWLTE